MQIKAIQTPEKGACQSSATPLKQITSQIAVTMTSTPPDIYHGT